MRWFIAAYGLLGAALFSYGGYDLATSRGALRPFGAPEPAALAIADDMRRNPLSWHGDEITITNGKVCVWIGNSVYGLGVEAGTHCGPERGSLSDASRYAVLAAARRFVVPRLRQERLDAVGRALQ